MGLNKAIGNMYPWVTHTWNAIKGKCPHDCSYCYMKRFPQPELHLDEKCLKDDLGSNNFIFVGSSVDMFAEEVDDKWIRKVLAHCNKFDNEYLFQSKNVIKIWQFLTVLPRHSIIGTTIETNRNYNISKAPSPKERMEGMVKLKDGI